MREIKFRIWLTSENRMLKNPYIQGRDQINDIFNGKNNKYIWMQYTGLRDAKGKEIYEGDICRFDEQVWEVIFNVSTGQYEHWVLQGNCCEVIGNKYENPELIKELE